MTSTFTYTLISDGACSGNPGPGGWAAIIIDPDKKTTELSQGYAHTTNNRMELRGFIEGLRSIPDGAQVIAYLDSEYVINAIVKKWIDGWKRNGWKTAAKKPVANQDLWLLVIEEIAKKNVKFHWVRGHNGHEENERADELAVAASQSGNLIEDEKGEKASPSLF